MCVVEAKATSKSVWFIPCLTQTVKSDFDEDFLRYDIQCNSSESKILLGEKLDYESGIKSVRFTLKNFMDQGQLKHKELFFPAK